MVVPAHSQQVEEHGDAIPEHADLEADPISLGLQHPVTNGIALSSITRASQQPCLGVAPRELLHDLAGPIRRTVVDDDDLIEHSRGAPDFSFDADPYTGVSAYDSTSCQGMSGWMVFGGTSVSSPSLAGIVNSAGGNSSTANELALI